MWDEIMGNMWNRMSPEEKQPYVEMATQVDKPENSSNSSDDSSYKPSTSCDDSSFDSEEDDEHAPKKPMSAFMFFVVVKRSEIKKDNPGASFGQIGKMLADMWKRMTTSEKEPYMAMAMTDYKRYDREMLVYHNKGDEEESSDESSESKEDPNAPKKPLSAFAFYASVMKEQVEHDSPDASVCDIEKLLQTMWNHLFPIEQAAYIDMARKDKERYEQDMRNYKPRDESSYKSFNSIEKDDPNAPKKPLSPFAFYAHNVKEQVKADNPDVSVGEIGKLLTNMWKQLPPEDKQSYLEMSVKDRQRYVRDMSNYRPQSD